MALRLPEATAIRICCADERAWEQMTEALRNAEPDYAPAQRVTKLVAGPPSASPPFTIALLIVGMSFAAPFIFVADGSPSPLLGIAMIAVALAGIITLAAAIRAAGRRRADSAARTRVSISEAGITLHPTPRERDDLHFPWQHIAGTHMAQTAFFVHAASGAPKPGRHAVRFGKLSTQRADILAALGSLQPPGADR